MSNTNNTEKLSDSQLGKIIAMYMPCLATFDNKDKGPYAIQGVSIDEGLALFEWDEDCDWWNYDKCKIILKPLSKISDEEIFNCYKEMGMDMWQYDFSKEHFLGTFSPTEVSKDKDRWGQSLYYIVLDYLRSKGYDCGYGSIPSLIATGVAVEK